MANEVQITVTSKDQTGPGLSSATSQTKSFGSILKTALTDPKQAASDLGDKLKGVGEAGIGTGSILKGALAAGAIAGGTALAKFAMDSVEKFAALTGEVRGFQRVAGTSAEDSSKLVFAMKELGIQPDAAASAFGRLEVKIGQNKLGEYTSLVAKAKDGTVDMAGTIANVADAFQKTEDPAARAAMGMQIFGKGWQTLLPLLLKNKDALNDIYALAEKQHAVFSQGDLETGRQFTQSMAELKTQFQGIAIEAAKVITPFVTGFAKGITSAMQGVEELTGDIGGVGGAAKLAFDASPLGNFTTAAQGFGEVVDGDIGGGLLHITESLIPMGGLIDDIFGGDEPVTFAEKQQGAADALNRAKDLAAQGKTNTKEYRDAMADAKGTTDELAASQQQLATDFQSAAAAGQQATQAMLGKWSADINAANAAAKVTEAQNAYAASMLETGIGATFKQAEAERNLETAIINASVAAGNAAVAKLGPLATADQKAKAGTDAQVQSLWYLASTIQGPAREAIISHIAQLKLIPGDKTTNIIIEKARAEQNIIDFVANARKNIPDTMIMHLAVAAPSNVRYTPYGVPQVNFGFGWVNMRQHGGEVKKGRSYGVGEEGFEIFTPTEDGYITPHDEATHLASPQSGARTAASAPAPAPVPVPVPIPAPAPAPTITYELHLHVGTLIGQPDELIEFVAEGLRTLQRRTGPLGLVAS